MIVVCIRMSQSQISTITINPPLWENFLEFGIAPHCSWARSSIAPWILASLCWRPCWKMLMKWMKWRYSMISTYCSFKENAGKENNKDIKTHGRVVALLQSPFFDLGSFENRVPMIHRTETGNKSAIFRQRTMPKHVIYTHANVLYDVIYIYVYTYMTYIVYIYVYLGLYSLHR